MTDGLSKEGLINIPTNLLKNISNLIFDLGEVIVDIDTSKTNIAFSKILQLDSSGLYTFHHQVAFFKQFEKGLISENDFRNNIRSVSNNNELNDDEIDSAWNAMIGETPQKKLDALSLLKKTYKVYALSNTNSIHIRFINDLIKNRNGQNDSLENYFHHAYYSHDLKARKPDFDIYEKIIDLENIIVADTLFIDDRIENIKTAQKIGMQTFHMTHPEQFYDIFL